MQLSTSRSIAIIAGLFTLLLLSGGALALGFHNGWLRTAASTESSVTGATQAGTENEAAQAPPIRLASTDGSSDRITNDDRDDDHRERRSQGRDSDDH